MKDVSSKGGSTILTARKLDILGSIKPHYGLLNNKGNLTRPRNQVFLDNYITDIQAHYKTATLHKKASDAITPVLLAADAREDLTANNVNM